MLVLAAALATLALAAPPAPGAPAPRLDWSLPAGAAIATPDAIVMWAPDFRSVLGVDANGKRLWRVATGDQGGFRDLDVIAPNVLVYAGAEAILVQPKGGKVLGRLPDVRLGAPGVPGCRVEVHAGACALRCPCSFLPLRCEDLAPAAPRATMPYFEEWDLEGERQSICLGSAGAAVARAGDTLVATVAGGTDAKAMIVASDLVGFDVRSAKEVWRTSELAGMPASAIDPTLSGTFGDGRTCWIASRSGALRIFDCHRATLRASRALAVPAGAEPQLEPDGDGLVVRDGAFARRLIADGKVVWETPVAADRLFVLAGRAAPRHRRFAKLAGATVLDPATGAVRGALPFVRGTTRWPMPWPAAPGGWIALGDKDWAVLLADRSQPIGGQSPAFIEDLVPGSELLALRTRGGIAVRGLEDAFTADVDGDVVVAVEGVAGPGRVLVLKDGAGPWDPKDPKTFGELRRYTLKAAPGRTAP